jgi:predicted transcriptional regulator/predicted nucleotidyltransferase
MTIQIKGKEIAGIPATKVRNALRRAGESFYPAYLMERLHISRRATQRLVRELLDSKFIEKERWKRETYYRLTALGQNFMHASAMKRMPRAKGDAMLAAFMERVAAVNDADYIYRVTSVVAFGSFARGWETIGDLDVLVELTSRYNSRAETIAVERLRTQAAIKQGRRFSNIVEELCWPRHEVLLRLKSRQAGLSLHGWEELPTLAKDEKFAYRVLLGDPEKIASMLGRGENKI